MTGSYKQHVDVEGMSEPRSSWSVRGACSVDPTPFMQDPMLPIDVRRCKEICGLCPVAKQCLAYAIANDERYGIWGGMNRKERKALKSKLDVSRVPLEFRDHYLNVEGRVRRMPHPTPRYVRNPNLDLVIDPDFLAYLDAFA